MALKEFRRTWAGWQVVAELHSSFPTRKWLVTAILNGAELEAIVCTSTYRRTRREATANLDAWMTEHIKRPRARRKAVRDE